MISFTVNGQAVWVETPPMARLLDVLRHELGLTGTKEGCGEGECGACSVILDGDLVNSCLIPISHAKDSAITTIEGVAVGETLHSLQQNFINSGGAQCGICTPGMIMACLVLLKKNPDPSLEEIKEGLSGNLCRCTGYQKIFESVLKASKEVRCVD